MYLIANADMKYLHWRSCWSETSSGGSRH